jgi:N-acyl-D-aspartate/D-glutamate deacylase
VNSARSRRAHATALAAALLGALAVPHAAPLSAQAVHRLVAGPATVAFGHYDPAKPGVLRIRPGDIVDVTTMLTSSPTRLVEMGLPASEVQPNLAAIYEQVTDRGPGGHILTGPIHVEGAEPGDVLEVRILSVDYSIPYGYNGCSGFVRDLCDADRRSRLIRIDTGADRAEIAPGITIPLRPFFGSMGVAPPPDSGRVSSVPPGRHAGNMDLKELVAGTSVFIPVWVEGALFEVGDGHAAQGDGEVNQTGLETSLEGRLEFRLHKDRSLDWPRAETPTHHILMGFDPDLERATEIAIRETVELLMEEAGLSSGEAYGVVSMAVDLRITELVDQNVGVHAMVAKSLLPARGGAEEVDLLIRGGTVFDGSGSPGRTTDVGVRGDRIVFVGDAETAGITAPRMIDATGLIVAPGFIDPHAHAQGDLAAGDRARRENLNYLMQGVTTVVVGNDGQGTYDVAGARAEMEAPGIGTNAAMLVGFGAVRGEVMGNRDAAPTAAELERMKSLVDQAMRDGAVGLSTGLFYSPQSFSTTDEVVELARVAAAYGGTYDSHLRDESTYSIGLSAAVDEAIEMARRTGIRVNISHIKALGVDVWGQSETVLDQIRRARAEGLRVTADQYPYEASGSSVGASLLPRWAQAGGRDELEARLADPETRARLVADMRENLRRRNGPDAMLLTGGADELRGKTLAEVAAERGVDPIDAAIEIIRAGGAGIGSFNMSEDDIRTFMRADFVMTGSDGSGGHPRKYGTYPRKLRRYVLDGDVLSMERMIRASTSRPAEVFGLADRGRIAEGAFADVAVFDPATIRDEATFLEPELLATGMRWVLVNGVLAVEDGVPTHDLAGKVLARGDQPRGVS